MSDKKGGEEDGMWMVVLIGAFIALFCWVIWYLFKFQLIQFVLWVRVAELGLLALIFGDDHVMNVPGFPNRPMSVGEWRDFALMADPKEITLAHMGVTAWMASSILKYLFCFILILLMLWSVFKGPTSMYRRTLGLDGLIHEQSKIFRSIVPFVNFNPSDLPFRAPGSPVPAELPLFSEALGPEEWIAFNKIPLPDGKVDYQAAERAFARQLGPRWTGALKQPDYIQIILAAFCLKSNRKRTQADDMLGRLASCWNDQKGLMLSRDRGLLKEARKILKDKKLSDNFHKKINKHAFVATALLRGLDVARSEGGVLAPAQFVWLRGHNRALWYPLNNLGRQAFHMEAIGATCHYRAEKQVDRPIPRPKVIDAVKTLDTYMNNPILARPIPQLDYSMVKDKGKNKGVLKPV